MSRKRKNRFMFALVVIFVLVYGIVIGVFNSETSQKKAEYAQLVEENRKLNDLNTAYNRELDYVTSPEGIKLYAHLYGWQFPDEVCYNAVTIGHD